MLSVRTSGKACRIQARLPLDAIILRIAATNASAAGDGGMPEWRIMPTLMESSNLRGTDTMAGLYAIIIRLPFG